MNDEAEKQQLRRDLRQRRRAVPAADAQAVAQRCAQILAQTLIWRRSAHIALYMASDGEVDAWPIAERARGLGRRLYLPRVRDGVLEFADWRPTEPLDRNRYGIGEPRGPARALGALDLLLMPLVAWSDDGARLGMGGGFYDRTLAQLAPGYRPLLVGLAFNLQRRSRLPSDPWDIPLDAVLSETGLLPISPAAARLAG